MSNSTISLISRVHGMTHQWLSQELAAAGLRDVVPSHGDVLAILFQRGEVSMHEIAEFAHRTRPTVTVLVGKLERMGLVQHRKSKTDGRSTLVSLTRKGEELRPVFDDISRRLIELVTLSLSGEESETLEKLLGKVLSNMKKHNNSKEEDHEKDSHRERQ